MTKFLEDLKTEYEDLRIKIITNSHWLEINISGFPVEMHDLIRKRKKEALLYVVPFFHPCGQCFFRKLWFAILFTIKKARKK